MDISSFEEWNIHIDSQFFLRADQIWSDTTPIISLKKAEQLNLKMDLSHSVGLLDSAEQKKKIILETVYKSGLHQGLAPLLSCESFLIEDNHYSLFLRPRIAEFCLAMQGGDLEQIRNCTAQIAGCGPGLTPSADDFICGFLSVWALCETAPLELIGNKIKAAAYEAAKHTNDVSASFLKNYAEGLYPLEMFEFIKALASNSEPKTLRKACEKIIQFGSTSGTDYLCGIYYALKQIKNPGKSRGSLI